MSKRVLVIAIIVAIAGLGIWRYVGSRVDRSKPEAVAAAFFAALKSKNLEEASDFWMTESAEAWRTAAEDKLYKMQTGTHTRFFEDLPDSAALLTKTVAAGANAAVQTFTANGMSVDVRQIDGNWYVCRAPL